MTKIHVASCIKGFTLIELSVVLVIIALLVGGIVTGKVLVRQSQIMSVITDVQTYSTAVKNFQSKFNALPGDMANATTYWGANSGTPCGSFYSSTTSITSTCNGNGDGQINGGFFGTAPIRDEEFYLWKYLTNAGLIKGNYSGKDMGAGGASSTGVNVPASRVANGGYIIVSNIGLWGPNGGTWTYPWTTITNVFVFGSNYQGDTSQLGAVITPSEALALDQKIDDGKPGTGIVKSTRAGNTAPWGTANCADNYDPNLANYMITQTSISCSLLFDMQ